MKSERFVLKKEVKKYSTVDIVLHHAASGLVAILIVTGLGIALGGGGFWEVSHVWSGVLFVLVVASHLGVLIARGVTRDVPVGDFPFLFRVRDLVGYLRDRREPGGKFTIPERVDYFFLMVLSLLLVISGILLRFPNLLPGRGGIEVIFSILSIHSISAVGFTFWFLVVHLYISVIAPLPGNEPLSIFGRAMDVGRIRLHRPAWFEALIEGGYVELVEEKESEEKVDRERVESLLNEGNARFRKGEFEEAERLYREAIALYPAYSQAHYNLAVVLRKMGRRDEAVEQCRRFLEVDPFHPLSERVKEMIKEMEESDSGS